MLSYKTLGWDSDFFGFPVAQITAATATQDQLREALTAVASQGVRLVYWFCEPLDVEANAAALALRGTLADSKCTYQRSLSVHSLQIWPQEVEPSPSEGDRDALVALALQSAQYSRFRVDPNMPAGRWVDLYTMWMDRSLSGELADATLLVRLDRRPAGMITISTRGRRAQIGLFAVDPSWRRRGIGGSLLRAAMNRAASAGCDQVFVVSQDRNAEACRAYERAGFARASLVHVYHFWTR